MKFRMEIHLEAHRKGTLPLETAVVSVFVYFFYFILNLERSQKFYRRIKIKKRQKYWKHTKSFV